MRFISNAIASGAKAYLFRQYRTIGIVLIVLAVLIGLGIGVEYSGIIGGLAALSFVVGALGSMLAGYLGMYVTTRSASRAAQAARRGMGESLKVAWRAGAVMGLSLASVALIIISALYLAYRGVVPAEWGLPLVALGFGASLITLFMRVGGGIYTKAADLGADLVGKVEAGIPEDDPRNPGVIADNVGDNVGDVAGMAADVFESYIVILTGTIFLGYIMGLSPQLLELPLLYGGLALLATFIGLSALRASAVKDPMASISSTIYLTIILSIVLFFIASAALLGPALGLGRALLLALSASLGAVLAPLILKITDYYTSFKYRPVVNIAEQAKISPATVIVTGYSVGLLSAVPVILVIAAVLGITYYIGYAAVTPYVANFQQYAGFLAGIYGTAIASTGLLSVAGIIITADSFGPVSDNANGVVEMANLPEEVRNVTDVLDSIGNTTKATTKGYAIASAALAALVLFIAFIFEVLRIASSALGSSISLSGLLNSISLVNPNVLIGALIGAVVLYVFSSRTLGAVGRTAMEIVEEIRRQFRERPGILEWKETPDYARVVDIATRHALGEFLIPGLVAIAVPVITALVLGWQALAGLILGAIVAGVPRALLMANAGGAWDNAKKYIELGHLGGKRSEAHKAAVVGDTVGDPFKDTTGPSINPLIKVLNTLSVVLAVVIIAVNIHAGILLSGLLPYLA
jgi:K(+)-stimulated pyrophosphate-energized sodium pump